ncbi:hypothetical protein PENCOP_c007G00005 [Penicillium coprophilum]|uniref:Uncharacterized protein n=1 Tax=Penicillium coprophilum TaxID=36646 RepID=A0A1V6UKT8_9EURO|nr:hypothetical protein PENCOP_c007G00005 [Penicillium coprophilum]
MATVEKTKQQPKKLQAKKLPVQEDLSDGEDYDSADDYTDDSEYEDEVPTKNQKGKLPSKQLQKKQQKQPQYDSDDYTDGSEYDEDDYEYSDDEAVQPYSNENSDFKPNGGMDVLKKEEKSMLDEEGMKLRLELNLEIEVELKARIHGDLTIALM